MKYLDMVFIAIAKLYIKFYKEKDDEWFYFPLMMITLCITLFVMSVSFFFIDNNWKLNSDLSFEYSFNFSELTDQEISTLTFYINDIPIKSESIKYDTISKNGSFLIPKDMIKFGRNKFTIYIAK